MHYHSEADLSGLWPACSLLLICKFFSCSCLFCCAPAQRARYKRVRCRSDPWSANCIEEQGPWFHMPSDNIVTLCFRMKRYQELGDIFPLSSEDAGSGSNTVVEAEPASGSGLGDSDSFPALLESLRGSELQEKLSEEDLLL
uniref:Serglycin n=1 Tax=Zonotrichia albicollis TaxID=44394 RepID=A0A8D2N6I3_ZONAL